MSLSTPTPRTDGEITSTGAYTCIHHSDQQRAACPVCLVAALTAERDQLRADCENETKWAAHYLAQAIAARGRGERAEADLAAERARLDWLMAGGMCLVQHSGGFHVCRLNCQVSRAAIDLGMKEDAN